MNKLVLARRLIERGRSLSAVKVLRSWKAPLIMKGEAFFLEGEALRLSGFFERAARAYRKAAAASGWEPPLFIESLTGLASVLRTLGLSKRAFLVASKARRTALKHSIPALELKCRLEAALALRAQGRHKEALKELKIIMNKYRSAGDMCAVGFIWWAVGGIFRLEGKYKESVRAFRKSLEISRRLGDSMSAGYSMFGLAGVLRVSGNINASEGYYRRAAVLFSRTQDLFAKAYGECGLANALRQKGKLEAALEGYKRAGRLYSRINDSADLGYVEWGIGKILEKRGRLREALGRYLKAKKLFRGRFETRGELLADMSAACVLYALGKTQSSETLYDKAVKKAHRSGLHTHLEIFT